MIVHVYGKPGCIQCKYTSKELDKNHIPHEYHDITLNKADMKIVQKSGRLELPFVVAGEDEWHGFRIDKIRALVAEQPLYAQQL